MHFLRLLASALLALALLSQGPARADSVTTPNGIVATDFSLGGGGRAFGGALLRVQLSNPTPFAQEVRLDYPDSVSSYDVARITTTVTVPPGSTTMAELPLPVGNVSGRLSLTDSSRKPATLDANDADFRSWNNDATVYATPSVRFHAIQDRLKAGFTAGSHSSPLPVVLTTQGAAPWPEDFRAYCRYAGCMLSADEFAALSPSVRTALFDYAAAGGVLCLFGTSIVPAHPFASPAQPMPKSDEMRLDHLGYGTLVLFPAPTAESLSDPALNVLTGWLEESKMRLGHSSAPSSYAAHWKTLVSPPVHIAGVFLVLVLFSILAGPVLVVVLARRNRRIQILWILPSLSAAFCLILLAVFLLANGVRPTLLRDAGVLLDQGSGRAVVAGHVSVLAPLSLRRGLVFDRGSILRPDQQGGNSSGHRRTIEVGATQVANRNWVVPGIVTGFITQSVAPTHQRIEFGRDETGAITAHNLLGAPIASLEYWDENGRYYTLSNLDFGAAARLSPDDGKPQPHVSAPKFGIPFDGSNGVRPPVPDNFFREKTGRTRACFIAEIETDCPFLPDPLPGSRAHRIDHAVVFGLLDSTP